MHSENNDDQQKMLAEIEKLEQFTKDKPSDKMRGAMLKFGKDHADTIAKFGRYPTRNKALGRANTPEEEEYLKNADGWGQ